MALSALAIKNAEKMAASGATASDLSSNSQEFRDYVAKLQASAAPKPQPVQAPAPQPSQGLNINMPSSSGVPIQQVISQPTTQQQQPTVQVTSSGGAQQSGGFTGNVAPAQPSYTNDPNLMSQYLQITGSNWGLGRAITPQDISSAAVSYGKPDPNKAPSAKAISSKPMLDPTGQFFQTDDPAVNKFLNEVYVPLIEQELSTDPTALLNPKIFDMIKGRVETTWGPIFKNELDIVKQKYDLQEQGVKADQGVFQRKYGTGQGTDLAGQGTELTRKLEDLGLEKTRLSEDVGVKKQRLARNYQEAMSDSQMAMASRNLVYGGTRLKEEAKLKTGYDEGISDVEQAQKRKLEDMGMEQSRMEADIPFERDYGLGKYQRSLSELSNERSLENQSISAARTLQEAEEKSRLRTLGGTLIKANANL